MAADEFTCATGAGRSDPARGPLAPLNRRVSPGATSSSAAAVRGGARALREKTHAPPSVAPPAWADPASVRRAKQSLPWRRAVAAVIAATRRDRDVTQAQLAARIGWSRDKLAKAEAGTRRIELGDVLMIAQALGERTERVISRILSWHG